MYKSLIVMALVLGVCVAAMPQQASAAITDGLISYWPFDEGAGTVAADVPGNNDGALLAGQGGGIAPQWAAGKWGQALQFDGVSSYVDCGNAASLKPNVVSVSAWVKQDAIDYYGQVVGFATDTGSLESGYSFMSDSYLGGSDGYIAWISGGTPSDGSYMCKNTNYTLGQWTHVAMTYNGSQTIMYVNGIATTPSTTESGSIDYTYMTSFYIGVYWTPVPGAGEWWLPYTGLIDDVGVWNRALTAAEVSSLAAGNPIMLLAGGASPPPGAVGVNPAAVLSWSKPPQLASATSNVYFGTSSSPPLAAAGLTATTYDPPGSMSLTTKYYWRVDLVDGSTTYPGNEWSFTIGGKVVDPSPPSGYQNAPTPVTNVTWTGDDWVDSSRVYAGTNPAAMSLVAEVTEPGVDIPTPNDFTTYYWKVDEYIGTMKLMDGDTWNLQTGGLIGWWKLEENPKTDPNIADSSGHGFHGAVYDANSVIGAVGKAIAFSGGATSYGELPRLDLNSNNVTISAWVKPQGMQPTVTGLVHSRDGNSVAGLNFQGGTMNTGIRYHWNGGEWGWVSGLEAPDNAWSHIVLVVEPTKATIYLNATRSAVHQVPHAPEQFDGITNLARDRTFTNRQLKGAMDDVRIYNRPLSAEQVAALYEASDIAKYPDPADGQTDIPLDQNLSWIAGQSATAHNVYFGTNQSSLPLVSSAQMATSYDPGTLTSTITYYWQVNEITGSGTVQGNMWRFTTIPPRAHSPNPADGATAVNPAVVLSWGAGAGALWHNVYLGTNATSLPLVSSAQSATTYNPTPDLNWATKYYWRIDEYNGSQIYQGLVWSFTTIVPVCDKLAGDVNGDCYVDLKDLAELAGNWLVCGWDPPEACR
jgi:hypothetical protein